MPPQERVIETPDGRRLLVAEWGDPGGFPVVSHHGTPGSRLDRHPDERIYVESGVRLICYDRPGYGGSTRSPGRRVVDAAEDVTALADALSLGELAVVGTSGGGPHALACAARLAARVPRVAVLVGAAPPDDPALDFTDGMADVNIVEFGAAIEGSEPLARVLAPWVEALKADPNTALEVLARELPEPDRAVLRRPPVWALIRKSFSESVRQGDCGWMDDDLAFVKPWGFDPAAICVPVRLWQGELDVLVPRSHGEYLAARIPGASFELVPNEGHLLFDHVPTVMRWLVAG